MSDTPKHSKKGGPVFGYLAILFAAAFLMLLLAHFIQQRDEHIVLDRQGRSVSAGVETLSDGELFHVKRSFLLNS